MEVFLNVVAALNVSNETVVVYAILRLDEFLKVAVVNPDDLSLLRLERYVGGVNRLLRPLPDYCRFLHEVQRRLWCALLGSGTGIFDQFVVLFHQIIVAAHFFAFPFRCGMRLWAMKLAASPVQRTTFLFAIGIPRKLSTMCRSSSPSA